MTYKIGILDQSPIFPNRTAQDALKSTVELAQKAESWGYHRFWVAEHHQSEDVAGASPEILMSHLLAQTNKIKIGAGGVMLQHYSPYKVAENFHVMEALAPERVELGIGKAPGGLNASTAALRYGGTGNDTSFEERFTLLQQFLSGNIPEDHALSEAVVHPKIARTLPTFLLGASVNSARFAARLGANFVFASFLNGDETLLEETMKAYRALHPHGKFIIAVAAFVGTDQQAAEEEADKYNIYKVTFESGRALSVVSLDQVEALWRQTNEPFEVHEQKVQKIAGTQKYVKEEFGRLARTFDVDEFIVHTPVLDEAKRLQSFELLSVLNKQYV